MSTILTNLCSVAWLSLETLETCGVEFSRPILIDCFLAGRLSSVPAPAALMWTETVPLLSTTPPVTPPS